MRNSPDRGAPPIVAAPGVLFTYGTLMFPDVWRQVVGREARSVEATLIDYAPYRVDGEVYPALVAESGAETRGVVYLGLTGDEVERLDRFEGELYERRRVTVLTGDGRDVLAECYVARRAARDELTDELWDADEFVARGGLGEFQGRYRGFAAAVEATPIDKEKALVATPALMSAAEVIALLGLVPLPEEGGYYRETFRSPRVVAGDALGPEYASQRNTLTAIYFVVTADSPSAWHVLPSDEVFLWHAGASVEMLRLPPEGPAAPVRLGADLAAGERPQAVVAGGVWQGCRLADAPRPCDWALLSCLVAPGFDFADFRVASPAEVEALVRAHPELEAEVRRLAPRDG
ncbi:MAG: cupin domain-containing protein [Lacipirellulaceae bacterium]